MARISITRYAAFENNGYNHLMPQLVTSGLMPVRFAESMGLMRRAIEDRTPIDFKLWLSKSLYTADCIVFGRHELEKPRRFKLYLNKDSLVHLNPKTNLIEGALPISDELYKGLPGPEFIIVFAGGERFAVLADRLGTNPKGEYKIEEVYRLRGTAIGRPLGNISFGEQDIDEIAHSDLWLLLSGYDLGKHPASPQNKAAIRLKNGFRKEAFKDITAAKNSDRAMAVIIDEEFSQRFPISSRYNLMRDLILGNANEGYSVIGNRDLDKAYDDVHLVGGQLLDFAESGGLERKVAAK